MTDYSEIYRKNGFSFGGEKFTIESGVPEAFKTPWGIITAWNPDNKELPLEVNRQRNLELEAMLRQSGHKLTDGVGGADNHFEESFLVEKISFEETIRLGREFGQYSIYWCDGQRSGYYLCSSAEAILIL